VPNKTAPGALYITWLATFSRPLLFALVPRLFLIGFNYAQPFLINAAIALASQPVTESYNNIGYGLIGAYILVYVGIAVGLRSSVFGLPTFHPASQSVPR
jgi:ATP-binding cassette, subfamily C (CFTR/MRP), member 1